MPKIFTALTAEERASFDARELDGCCADCRNEIGLRDLYINLDGSGPRVRHHPLVCAACYHKRAVMRVATLTEDRSRAERTLTLIERELAEHDE